MTSFFGASYGTSSSQYFYDVGKSWPVILISVLLAVIISYLYLVVVRVLGGVLIWLSIALTASIFFTGGFYTFFYAKFYYDPLNPTYTYLANCSYVLWGLAALTLLTILFCFNSIKIGTAVFKTTAQFIQANLKIFILPGIVTLISCVWFLFWLFAAVYIFSVGTPAPRKDFPYITNVKWSQTTRLIFIYHAFALWWINTFIIGCT